MGSEKFTSQTPKARRRRRLVWAGLTTLVLAGIATAALFLPMLAPLFAGGTPDERHLAFERGKRRLLASWGLPMRGAPDHARLAERLADHGLVEGAPVFVRIFKHEFELELWMQRDGVFHRFATYPVCRWSGTLGPKLREGDRQTPEGFYTVDQSALNPNSNWYRSFNLGFPNAYDRAHNRTGSFIMVHGGCASIGCFAMTNAQMAEIWRLVTAALDRGQARFQVQVLPFRMSDERLAHYANEPSQAFWKRLKAGSDLFESKLLPPRVSVCKGQYVFEAGARGSTGDDAIVETCLAPNARPAG